MSITYFTNRVITIIFLIFSIQLITKSQSGWVLQQSGTTNTLRTVFFLNSDTGFVAGGNQGNGLIRWTINGGSTWNLGTTATDILRAISFTTPIVGISVGDNGIAYRSLNGGFDWSSLSTGVSIHLNGLCFISGFIGIAVGDGGTILRTTDAGGWTPRPSGTSNFLNAVHLQNNNIAYAVGQLGIILKSTDGGLSWSEQNSNVTSQLRSVFGIGINIAVAVGDEGTILRTEDGGSNWTPQSIEGGGILRGVYFTSSDTGTIVGSSGTILHTTDGGTNWIPQTSGTVADLFAVYFTDAYTGTVVGEAGTILHTLTGGTTSIDNNQMKGDIRDFALYQNYPNPFNPSTKIEYYLPRTTFVSIIIYDFMGKEIKILIEREQSSGNHLIVWDGTNFKNEKVSSSIYFYKLETNETNLIRKMVFLK